MVSPGQRPGLLGPALFGPDVSSDRVPNRLCLSTTKEGAGGKVCPGGEG